MSYLYLMVVSLYALFLGFKFIKPLISEIRFRIFTIFLGLNMIFFFLIDIFTIKPRPDSDSVSGNGNPGLLVLMFLVPIFLYWLGIWYKFLYKGFQQESSSTIKKHLLNGSLLFIAGVVLQFLFCIKQFRKVSEP